MTRGAVADFCSLQQRADRDSFRGLIMLAKAWKKSNAPGLLPEFNISMLLGHALSRFLAGNEDFSLLTLQVTLNCLTHHVNPLPLASLVCAAANESDEWTGEQPFQVLQYARSLLGQVRGQEYARPRNLQQAAGAVFHRESPVVRLTSQGFGPSSIEELAKSSGDDGYWRVAFKVGTHMLLINEDSTERQRYYALLRSLAPHALRVRTVDIA